MVKNIGGKDFFEMLWQSAVKLRGALEPGEYKHPVLGLLFLKYVSDSFVEMQENLKQWTSTTKQKVIMWHIAYMYTVENL